MELIIRGSVSGKMLVGAMLQAQTATCGNLKSKQNAGIDMFNRYLETNPARRVAWEKKTSLSPSVVVARASLDSKWLKIADQLFTETTDAEQRRAILGQVIAPHITLFGVPIIRASKPVVISADTLVDALSPELPKPEMEMLPIAGGEFITANAVTEAQYTIGIRQTGCEKPFGWENDFNFQKHRQSSNEVIGVSYDESDAFARWLGREVPTLKLLCAARKELKIAGLLNGEWTATKVKDSADAELKDISDADEQVVVLQNGEKDSYASNERAIAAQFWLGVRTYSPLGVTFRVFENKARLNPDA